uniref:Uncharacterized protein n=1 Tax=Anguilla anguilla TaxID=7936 RepID=A0A0E9RIR2_ANGAN
MRKASGSPVATLLVSVLQTGPNS